MAEVKLNLTTDKDSILLYPAENYSALMPKSVNTSSVDIKIEKPDSIDAPIKVGQKIGTAVLSYANKELSRVDLVAAEAINQNPILFIIQCINNIIESIWFKIAIAAAVLLIVAYVMLFIMSNRKARRRHTKVRKHYK